MQGHFDHVYLFSHKAVYGGDERCYTNFIRLENGSPRRQDLARLKQSIESGLNITPQIIFNSEAEFQELTRALKDTGCHRIDLNLGCPYPMQTKKGRGSAMISNLTAMRKIAELIGADASVEYTIKMRLGLESADEWKPLIELLNDAAIGHIAVHPRTAKQMYDGELSTDSFAEILERSAHPVVYNGGIGSIADIEAKATLFPTAKGIMIGRGLLARPSLLQEWREGKEMDESERRRKLLKFHDLVLESYEATLCGNAQILQKIKPFWLYLESEIGHKAYKAIHKAGSIGKYRLAVESI